MEFCRAAKERSVLSIVPSIRGDGEGPDSPGRVFTLGQSEWLDVEAAVKFAINQGAQNILLIGWSSGASMALRLAVSSKYKKVISGLVLISPVLNWRNSILHSASNAGVARGAAQIAVTALSSPLISRILGVREPLRFEEINWTERPLERRLPTFVIHSKGDRTAPFGDSDQFANLNADCVTLVAVEPSEHALEWNADPERFDAHLQRWLVEQAFLASPVVGKSNV
jgi:acetyl esterase/lipase